MVLLLLLIEFVVMDTRFTILLRLRLWILVSLILRLCKVLDLLWFVGFVTLFLDSLWLRGSVSWLANSRFTTWVWGWMLTYKILLLLDSSVIIIVSLLDFLPLLLFDCWLYKRFSIVIKNKFHYNKRTFISSLYFFTNYKSNQILRIVRNYYF